ncbi:ABC transporter permease [uncultured Alistipes sp.]|mgnify:CR=1 FL=1|uniref:ABC transporter permease n=3 Tax=uncultured Alistipes sp. TaxID=538949 RepID=UPI0026168C06|nr:ABC transporter permease [uncultured Alistipes sp.]
MKIAFKNFLTTLRRYKASSLLNVAGLTMAFTAFYVIMVQVWWELGYNRSIPDAERIYLVAPTDFWDENGSTFTPQSPRPTGERLIELSPEIEAGGPLRAWFNTQPAWIMRGGQYVQMPLKIITASTGFLETMRATAAAGDLTDFVRPNTLLLARSEAERMGVGVGDAVWLAEKPFSAAEVRPDRQYEVVGIYDDFPANSGLAEIEAMVDIGDEGMDAPNNWNDTFFVRLREGTDPATIARRWSEINAEVQAAWAAKMRPLWIERYGQEEVDSWDEEDDDLPGCRLIPLSELYFERALESSHWSPGSRPTTLSLLAVALLVVAIALINFVNFFFALTPARLRTVNIFKVFGAPTASLRLSILFEAVGFVLVSLLAAWYVAFALQSTHLAHYVSTSISPIDNPGVLLLEAGVALAAALIAGLYPAWYITSFNPALAAKGSFAGSRGGRRLRTALVAVQYVVSIVLIVFTFFCYAQHRFVRRFDLGFEREQVLTFDAPRKIAAQRQSYETLVSRLASDPRIEGVTAASGAFVADAYTIWGRMWKGEEVEVHIRNVQPNFPEVMRIPMLEGGFRPEHGRDSIDHAIIPRSVADRFGYRPGELVDGMSIAGICADIQFRPLQCETKPLAILASASATRVVYLRIAPGSDIEEVCDGIRRAIGEVDPDNKVPDIRFMNEQIDDLYEKENRLAAIIALFTLLAVAIALMGVFGLVLFETQHRRREVAVRKVMGASTGEVLRMFNRRYIVITLVCFVVAAPAAWWGVERWLSGFAYRVPVSPWIFLAALAAVLAVTVATVTLRSLSAARSNPADAVKSE